MVATIILLFLLAMSLGVSLALHGKPKEGSYSFWETFIAVLIELVLLYYAGVFNNFK